MVNPISRETWLLVDETVESLNFKIIVMPDTPLYFIQILLDWYKIGKRS